MACRGTVDGKEIGGSKLLVDWFAASPPEAYARVHGRTVPG